jgi:NAD(P)-dependent dehydrogenase (short-subunit alcohol dehydrogenase family)
LISGASRGLGAALAAEFAARGDRVFAGMREPDPARSDAVELNVRCLDSTARAVGAVVAAGGPIDVLINNAGVHLAGPLCELDQDEFKATLDVNLLGVWRLTRAAVPQMRRGGTIAMISSLSGLVGMPDDGAYAASKFALEGMSQSLAAELAPMGIRVLVFEPGRIATGFAGANSGMTPRAAAAEIARLIDAPDTPFRSPLGDVAREVAETIGLDLGQKTEEVVKRFAGCSWQVRSAV